MALLLVAETLRDCVIWSLFCTFLLCNFLYRTLCQRAMKSRNHAPTASVGLAKGGWGNDNDLEADIVSFPCVEVKYALTQTP